MLNYKKFIRASFWIACFPFLTIISIYELLHHQSPLDSLMWQFAIMLCVPMLALKRDELSDKSFENLVNEFREMTNQEFLECEEEVMSLLPIRGAYLYKEAYRKAYSARWGREYGR